MKHTSATIFCRERPRRWRLKEDRGSLFFTPTSTVPWWSLLWVFYRICFLFRDFVFSVWSQTLVFFSLFVARMFSLHGFYSFIQTLQMNYQDKEWIAKRQLTSKPDELSVITFESSHGYDKSSMVGFIVSDSWKWRCKLVTNKTTTAIQCCDDICFFCTGSWDALQQCKRLPGDVSVLSVLDGEQNRKTTGIQGEESFLRREYRTMWMRLFFSLQTEIHFLYHLLFQAGTR